MNFVSIDFETANPKWSSVCAVGMVKVEHGEIVDEYYSLVNPEDYFSPFNINIHGITAKDVANTPNFHELSNQLWPWLADSLVVAHNASFDINVLRKVAGKYRLKAPDFTYACTCQLARATWKDLMNYKLSTIAEYLNLDLSHHNALSDARACANILLQAMKYYQCDQLDEMAATKGLQIKKF